MLGSRSAKLGVWFSLRLPLLAAATLLWSGPSAAQGPENFAPVVVAPVVEREVAAQQMFVGTLQPRRTSIVGSAVDGRVVELMVNEGDRVKARDPLAQILTGTLEIELASAQAELEMRRQELRELENGSRPEEIQQAEARMLNAKAAMDYTMQRYTRNEALFKRGQAITEDEMDKSLSTMLIAQRAYQEAQAAHALAVAGPREEQIARAKAAVQMQQEQVRHIEDRIGKHTVRSPFDGYVVRKVTEQGQWINQAEVVAEVVELDLVEAEVYVPEANIQYVKLGMTAEVKFDALPNQTFEGTVTRVVPQADSRSRTFPVKVQIANQTEPGAGNLPLLKAGMLARVGLPVAATQRSLLVHKDALVLGGASPMVTLVDTNQGEQGKVTLVPVEAGLAQGSWIQVRGPLRAGQRVVVRGNERLRPDTPVKIIDSLAAPAGR